MSWFSVVAISMAAGLILVIGGVLVVYMSSLVKSAYQLKVEIKAELEEGLRRIDEDMDKKSKWIKRDLLEEIDKIRTSLQTEMARRHQEHIDAVTARLGEFEETGRRERVELAKVLESHRTNIAALDQKQRLLKRDQQRLEALLGKADGEAAAIDGAEAPVSTAAAAAAAPATAAETTSA